MNQLTKTLALLPLSVIPFSDADVEALEKAYAHPVPITKTKDPEAQRNDSRAALIADTKDGIEKTDLLDDALPKKQVDEKATRLLIAKATSSGDLKKLESGLNKEQFAKVLKLVSDYNTAAIEPWNKRKIEIAKALEGKSGDELVLLQAKLKGENSALFIKTLKDPSKGAMSTGLVLLAAELDKTNQARPLVKSLYSKITGLQRKLSSSVKSTTTKSNVSKQPQLATLKLGLLSMKEIMSGNSEKLEEQRLKSLIKELNLETKDLVKLDQSLVSANSLMPSLEKMVSRAKAAIEIKEKVGKEQELQKLILDSAKAKSQFIEHYVVLSEPIKKGVLKSMFPGAKPLIGAKQKEFNRLNAMSPAAFFAEKSVKKELTKPNLKSTQRFEKSVDRVRKIGRGTIKRLDRALEDLGKGLEKDQKKF